MVEEEELLEGTGSIVGVVFGFGEGQSLERSRCRGEAFLPEDEFGEGAHQVTPRVTGAHELPGFGIGDHEGETIGDPVRDDMNQRVDHRRATPGQDRLPMC